MVAVRPLNELAGRPNYNVKVHGRFALMVTEIDKKTGKEGATFS